MFKKTACFLACALAASALWPAAAQEPHGSVFTVLLPPGSMVLVNQEFSFKAQLHYYDTPGDWMAKITVSSPDEPGNETMREAAFITPLTPTEPRTSAPKDGMIEHEFKATFKQKTGRCRILLTAELLTGHYSPKGQLGTYEFALDVYLKPRLTIKNLVPSPYGQGHILIGEEVPVRAEVEYKDLIPQAVLVLTLSGTELINSRYTESTQLARWQSPPLPGGNGTLTSPNIVIKPTREDDLGYEWRVGVKVETMWADPVSQALSFGVSKPNPLNVELSGVDHVKPPETIDRKEPTPVVIHITYRGLPNPTVLKAVVYDRDKDERIGSVDSESLSGSGDYTFRPIVITPEKSGEWKLQARVREKDSILVRDDFKIVVGEAVQQDAQVEILSIDRPPGTVKTGELFPIVVKASFHGLPSMARLKARVLETSSQRLLAEMESEPLPAAGDHVFKPMKVTARNTPGDWPLEVRVTISGQGSTAVKKTFKIKVVEP